MMRFEWRALRWRWSFCIRSYLHQHKLRFIMAGFVTAIVVFLVSSHLNVVKIEGLKPSVIAGKQLGVYLDEINNLGSTYTIRYTLTNRGEQTVDLTDSSIHLCIIRLPFTNKTSHENVFMQHVDGCYQRINIGSVAPLPSQTSLQFTATFKHWLAAYTDVMPNWYISYGDQNHTLIDSTNVASIDELKGIVAPFTQPHQYKRTNLDQFSPWTPKKRYKQFMSSYAEVDTSKDSLHLVPSPNSVEMDINKLTTRMYNDDSEWSVLDSNSDCPSNSKCARVTSLPEMVVGEHTITVQVNGQDNIITATAGPDSGRDVVKTLQQLTRRHNGRLPEGTISMKPRFQYRGYMMDVSRNFQQKQTVFDVLDLMSNYRLNKFHFHLSDDEGWRLAIDGLEELTENGVRMCFDIDECLYPQLGHQIDSTDFFTKEDYMDILKYAVRLGIEVIPEFDMPAHALAAVRAMNIRYKTNPTPDYRLAEPGDNSEYSTAQHYTTNAINPCLDSTYTFIEQVIQTVKSYHDEANSPLEILHIGFDELPSTAWNLSTTCNEMFSPDADNTDSSVPKSELINIHFFQRVSSIVKNNGINQLGVWEDGLMNNKNRPYDKATVFPAGLEIIGYVWQTVWEWGGGSRAYNLANAGYKIVFAPATRLYLDHPSEPDPENRGYFWATRYIDLFRAFAFRPDDIYSNFDFDVMGTPETREGFCDQETCPPITEEGKQNIIGMEAPLFGETIRTHDNLASNTLPRLLAIAERAWSQKEWENTEEATPALYQDFTLFKSSVGKYELTHLKDLNFGNYLISPPGISVENNKLKIVTEFPLQRVWSVRNATSRIEVSDGADYTKDMMIFVASDETGEMFSRAVSLTPHAVSPTNVGFQAQCLSSTIFLVCAFCYCSLW